MSKRLALIVGNSLYRDETLSRLTSPDADVGALTDTLLAPELGGFDDLKLLVNSASHIVRREIFNFFSKKSRTDLLLFYFTGHGVLDERGRLYLALKDTDTKALRGTAIPASYITDEMDNSRSRRQVLVLDCCHSGAFARGTKGTTGKRVGTGSAFQGSGFGRVVLTASDATQYAWEGDQIIGEAESSLFTHFIVQGIQTGEADANQDGNITIDEIYDYAYNQMLEFTPNQTPGKWSFKEQGELIIARSPGNVAPFQQSPSTSFVDEEEQQRLRKLYMNGLSAFWLEDWDKVAKNFEAILSKDPDYPDVREKLEEANRHKKHTDLYGQAVQKVDQGELGEGIALLEALVAEAPDYKDASTKLEKLRIEKTLADLYSEGQELFESGKYQAVIRIFEKIHAISPAFEDEDGLLEKAGIEAEKVKRSQMLEDLYQKALIALDDGNFQEAETNFNQLQELESGYKDSEKLLEKVEAFMSKEAEQALKGEEPKKAKKADRTRKVQLPEALSKRRILVGGLVVVIAAIILISIISQFGGEQTGLKGTIDGPDRIVQGDVAIFDIFISFQGEPASMDEFAQFHIVLIGGPEPREIGELSAESVGEGHFRVTLGGDDPNSLEPGTYRIEVYAELHKGPQYKDEIDFVVD